MKHLQTYESINYNNKKYKFNINDLVKLKHKYQYRIFKILERKRIANNEINTYYIETIDDNLDNGLWPIHVWEYQSKIVNCTPEEIEDYNISITANKYNL